MPTDDSVQAPNARRESLLWEYAEVASNFRLLTEIRFKLLAFLPIAAAAAAALRGTDFADPTATAATLGFSAFGLAVTAGLIGYNLRNDQLYNELVGRAAAIERELGLPDGAFANRPNASFALRLSPLGPVWPINHGRSVALIYLASASLWLFGVLYSLAQLGDTGERHGGWLVGACAGIAVALTSAAGWGIARQREARSDRMRVAAAAAMKLGDDHQQLVNALNAGLLDSRTGLSRPFRIVCRGLQDTNGFTKSPECTEARDALLKTKAGKTAAARACFYRDELAADSSPYLRGLDTNDAMTTRSYFLALITDLPPRWILDCGTGRRRHVTLRGIPAVPEDDAT